MTPSWVDDPVRPEMPVERLAEIASEYHQKTREAAGACMAYAITCGHALSLIREKVEGRSWLDFAAEWGISRTTAYAYMRIYRNREQLRSDMTLEDAQAVVDPLSRPRATPAAKAEAVRMVMHDGFTQEAAAESLRVAKSTITYWLKNSKQRRAIEQKRRRRQRRVEAAEAELRRKEHWVLSRQSDKPVAKAYGFLRQCAQQLHLAKVSASDPVIQGALDHALAEVYKAEELIAQTLGVQIKSDRRTDWERVED